VRILLCGLLFLGACGGDGGGGDVRTVHASGPLWGARFSPDGSRLAVAFGPDDKLGTIDLASGALTEVADNTSYLTGTSWSAAGDAIVYDGSGGIYRVAPGAAPVQLTDAFASMGVDLSPDGTRVAYGVNGTDAELYTIATDTTTPLGRPCQAIRFSPSGTSVGCISGGLFVIDLATMAETTVLADGLPFIAGLDWYADGQRLVVTSDDGLEAVTLAGARSVLLDTFAAVEVDLAPDEQSLVFATNGSADLSILDL
jgi:Tol biopolymer transport system component